MRVIDTDHQFEVIGHRNKVSRVMQIVEIDIFCYISVFSFHIDVDERSNFRRSLVIIGQCYKYRVELLDQSFNGLITHNACLQIERRDFGHCRSTTALIRWSTTRLRRRTRCARGLAIIVYKHIYDDLYAIIFRSNDPIFLSITSRLVVSPTQRIHLSKWYTT